MYCYELRSLQQGVPFTWSIWSPSVLVETFQILVDEKDEQSYLVVVKDDLVRLVTIDHPKSRTDSLVAYATSRAFSALAPVIVTRVLGREPFFTGTFTKPADATHPYEVHVLGDLQGHLWWLDPG